MSTKPETTYYTAVNKLLPKMIYREKMHNPYRGGTPDVWYSGNRDDLWVEYKYLKTVPKKAAIDVKKLLSPLQQKWLIDRYEEGRNVAVIIGTPLGGLIYTGRSWELSKPSRSAFETAHSKREVADFIAQKTQIQ